MTREAAVLQTLVDLADTLVEDYDVVDLLTALVDKCVDVLDFTAAGVMLVAGNGELRLVASSSETMRVVELFELQEREGPCLDAFRTGEQVEQANLHSDAVPWPRFASVALEGGFQSALALPLRLRQNTIGALNVFKVDPTAAREADVRIARAFADLATISILQQRQATEYQQINDQLAKALRSRIVIEQAKGIVFERAGIDMDEAFARLRAHARSTNTRLTDVAQAAVDGTLDSRAWEGPGTETPPRS